MGTDDIHKKSKAKRTITKKRIEQKSVLIALEDTKSSKFYFEELGHLYIKVPNATCDLKVA